MNYWCKNVELTFFKLICKIQTFQSSTGFHQGKILFSFILFKILYKAAVLNDIRRVFFITFSYFILLGDF